VRIRWRRLAGRAIACDYESMVEDIRPQLRRIVAPVSLWGNSAFQRDRLELSDRAGIRECSVRPPNFVRSIPRVPRLSASGSAVRIRRRTRTCAFPLCSWLGLDGIQNTIVRLGDLTFGRVQFTFSMSGIFQLLSSTAFSGP
jgi:hypothetical protein